MINRFGLSLIADVMGWDTDADAAPEYAWLRLMSDVKYDDYADFRAGVRFLENLATWLRQFDKKDRPAAYVFIKERLVFISAAELQRVIEIFVPETVTPYLRKAAAAGVGIKPHEVWGNQAGAKKFKSMLRRTLFVGMSDGTLTGLLHYVESREGRTDSLQSAVQVQSEEAASRLQKAAMDAWDGTQAGLEKLIRLLGELKGFRGRGRGGVSALEH